MVSIVDVAIPADAAVLVRGRQLDAVQIELHSLYLLKKGMFGLFEGCVFGLYLLDIDDLFLQLGFQTVDPLVQIRNGLTLLAQVCLHLLLVVTERVLILLDLLFDLVEIVVEYAVLFLEGMLLCL